METTPTPVIAINDFVMKFGNKTVIDGLSFQINQGETFGLLGSNGSGKTTTLRALLGIYKPTRGTLLVNGRTFKPEYGSEIGYLPEERGLYKKESVIDVMTYFGRLKGLDKAAAKQWSLAYLERVGLADKAKSKIDKLSGGQQQKVQLGVTIMNDPSVNRRLLMDIIDEQKAKGATIVLITHDMSEVERLCDRLLLLRDGNKTAYGTVPEVLAQYGKATMEEVFLQVYGAHAQEEVTNG